ncbi:MAG: hypothetical protein ACJAUP_000847 [Cellvibrionaceae bacterium]|jgi:hypothetical protein
MIHFIYRIVPYLINIGTYQAFLPHAMLIEGFLYSSIVSQYYAPYSTLTTDP